MLSVKPKPLPPAGKVFLVMRMVPAVAPAGGVPIWPRICLARRRLVAGRAVDVEIEERRREIRHQLRRHRHVGRKRRAADGKVNTAGPFCSNGASWTCADCGDGRLCVHCTARKSRGVVEIGGAAGRGGGAVRRHDLRAVRRECDQVHRPRQDLAADLAAWTAGGVDVDVQVAREQVGDVAGVMPVHVAVTGLVGLPRSKTIGPLTPGPPGGCASPWRRPRCARR